MPEIYPYDKIVAVAPNKSILLILAKEFNEQRFTDTVVPKTQDKDGCLRLFKLQEWIKCNFNSKTLYDDLLEPYRLHSKAYNITQ